MRRGIRSSMEKSGGVSGKTAVLVLESSALFHADAWQTCASRRASEVSVCSSVRFDNVFQRLNLNRDPGLAHVAIGKTQGGRFSVRG